MPDIEQIVDKLKTFAMTDKEMDCRIDPYELLRIYKKHNWVPMSGRFWVLGGGQIKGCCGMGAVVLDQHPETTEVLHSEDGDTRRANAIMVEVAAILGCGTMYTAEFTFGFDSGFDAATNNRAIGWSERSIQIREKAGILGLPDGIAAGLAVGAWWKNRQAVDPAIDKP